MEPPIEEDTFKMPSNLPVEKPETVDIPKNPTASPTNPENPYKVPLWSARPADQNLKYFFEVMKSGMIIQKFDSLQEKSFWTFGRLPSNDIFLEHPTISRFHAVLQYRPSDENAGDSDEEEKPETPVDSIKKRDIDKGYYLYDLSSTHGVFLNKMRIPPKTYIRLRVGHMIRFGNSSRSFLFQGPDEDQEEESELTITEMKAQRMQLELDRIQQAREADLELARQIKEKEDAGISWGMAEDAEEEENDLSVNPYAVSNNEELFLDDPKKTLRGFFEREGHELVYKCDEKPSAVGTFVCRIELPMVDDEMGRSIVAEVVHKGKKKDCVLQCALEACRILDRHGVLRQSNHEPRRAKVNHSDSDDDDDFLDRTGDVEKKRLKKLTAVENVAQSYDELLIKEKQLIENISTLDAKMEDYRLATKLEKQERQNDEDDLDSFMNNLNEDKPLDKSDVRKMKIELQNLRNDHLKLKKLILIAKPLNLPVVRNTPIIKSKPTVPIFTAPKAIPPKPPVNIADEKPESSEKPKKLLGPAFDPKLIDEFSNKPIKADVVEEEQEVKKQKLETPSEVDSAIGEATTSQSSKKRKNRMRIRHNQRSNVDIEDYIEEDEVVEKVVKWVPPENQKGDGMTSLNEKFGY